MKTQISLRIRSLISPHMGTLWVANDLNIFQADGEDSDEPDLSLRWSTYNLVENTVSFVIEDKEK